MMQVFSSGPDMVELSLWRKEEKCPRLDFTGGHTSARPISLQLEQ